MAWTYYGHGKSFFPVFLHKKRLAGDLVPGILPFWVGKRGSLCHSVVRRGLLVCGRGAYEYILSGPSLKHPVITLYVLRHKCYEVCHHVKFHALCKPAYLLLILNISRKPDGSRRQLPVSCSPVQQVHFVSLCQQPSGNRHADGSGASDK